MAWKLPVLVEDTGLGSAILSTLMVIRGSSITWRMCSRTPAVVSPGRIREFTVAVAEIGRTLSAVPTLATVTALVVRTAAFVAGDLVSSRNMSGSKSQRFANATRRNKGIVELTQANNS